MAEDEQITTMALEHLFVPSATNIKFVSLVCFLLTRVHYGTTDTRQTVVGLFKDSLQVISNASFAFLVTKHSIISIISTYSRCYIKEDYIKNNNTLYLMYNIIISIPLSQ